MKNGFSEKIQAVISLQFLATCCCISPEFLLPSIWVDLQYFHDDLKGEQPHGKHQGF